MEIYVVRHTTPAIEKGVCYGQSDLELASTFEEEFYQLSKNIPTSFDKLYSSPLKRCALLANKITDDIVFDDRLKEIDFGKWEMRKWDDIPRTESDAWMQDFVHIAPPHGESYIQLQHRVVDFYHSLLSSRCEVAVLITHAGVIRALKSYVDQSELKDSFSIKLSYGVVVKLEV